MTASAGRPGPKYRSYVPLVALLLATLGVLVTMLSGATPPAQAQQPQCAASINDVDVANFDSHSDAIDLPYSEGVTLGLFSNQRLGDVSVRIATGPFSNTVDVLEQGASANGAQWAGRISLEDYATWGVGLYQVTMTSESGCSQTLWVDVTGKSVLTTVAGGTASLVMLVGLASQFLGFFRAVRRSKGRWWSILGGVPVGLGACVISQQLGFTPITWQWMAIWTFPPVAFGGVVQGGLSTLLGGGRYEDSWGGEEADAPPPTASMPPPPPPTASMPPEAAPPPPPVATAPEPVGATPASPSSTPPAPTAGDVPRNGAPPSGATPGSGSGSVSRSARSPADREVRDPPRTSYALLDCPGAVVAEQEFELTFGLSPTEVPGVAGPALVRPASSIGAYFLTVQIVADGFDIRPDEHWRHELPVTADAPYPSASVHLTPKPQSEPVRSAAIQAIYSVSGQSMGFAVRPVAVVATSDIAIAPAEPDAEGATISLPTDDPAADLTVRVQLGHEDGTLLWTFDTPHRRIAVPDEPIMTDIGDDPQAFARKLVDQMGTKEGQPGVYLSLVGIGKTVSDQVPTAFWDLLEEIGDLTMAEGRQPGVFFLSEDPYVPWELALVRRRLDPALPEFLGAQACVGRWALGRQRPKLPPPQRAQVESMAVIWGEYNQPGWNRLLEAEQEAAALAATYSAINVNAARLEVLRCLNGAPEADVLHFAVHGIYDPNSVANGIVLVDGHFLDEFEVRGSNLGHAPFVFLNACQVGSGQEILGDYGGMAHAFLYAGAGGVVAPLWSIKDSIAREIATRFYEQAFDGVSPAEVLRRERAMFVENLDTTSATCMAYIWYGHPSFTLKRSQGDDQ